MQTIEGFGLIQRLMAKARHEGMNVWEVMEDDGFLLTDARKRQLKAEAVAGMLFILERETAEGLLRAYLEGRPSTAQDMFDAMRQWIRDYREALEAGHVG